MLRWFSIFSATVVLTAACTVAAPPPGEFAASPGANAAPSPLPSVGAPLRPPSPAPVATASVVPTAAPQATPSVSGVNLRVPFAPQAPYAVWDDLHNEACEEASMLLVEAYFRGRPLNAHLMEQGILDLVRWQTQNGYSVDVTAAETVKILTDYFHLPARLLFNPTVSSIRQELDAGHVVIMPAAGRRLGNPYYRQPGPLYHMLVIRGYDPARDEFITNDPGTKRGEAYRYKTSVLLSANHDWPKPGKTKEDVSDAEMEAGQKVMMVVGK